MFRKDSSFSQKYFPILYRFLRFEKVAKLHSIDFKRPWWRVVLHERLAIGLILVDEILLSAFLTSLPAVLSIVVTQGRYGLFQWMMVSWIGLLGLGSWACYLYCAALARTIWSTAFQATIFFLTVDPIYHSTRSSGQIIAKVNRGSEAFEDLVDTAVFDVVGILTSLSTIVITFFVFNSTIGWFALAAMFIAIGLSTTNQIIYNRIVSPAWIKQDDTTKAINIESLQQVAHIRAAFATQEQVGKLGAEAKRALATVATVWYGGITASQSVRLLYILSIWIIGNQILQLVQTGNLSQVSAIALLGTYFGGLNLIVRLGRSVERFSDRLSRITDLFAFIRGFGQRTYPVLITDQLPQQQLNPPL